MLGYPFLQYTWNFYVKDISLVKHQLLHKMRYMQVSTLILYLFHLSSEKPLISNWFWSTGPSHSSNNKIQESKETRMALNLDGYQNYYSFIKTTDIKKTTATTTTTTTTTTISTTTIASNIIFESNENIDFSVCHPENNPECVLDQVYSCTTSKDCDERGKCERKTVCGIRYFSKLKDL